MISSHDSYTRNTSNDPSTTTSAKRSRGPAVVARDHMEKLIRNADNDDDDYAEVAKNLLRMKKRPRNSGHRKVSWSSFEPAVFIQPDVRRLFPDYDEDEIWYSRQDYQDFFADRVRTIKLLESADGDDRLLDKAKYCLRGLEIFQSTELQEAYTSKRRVHQSTILIEQVRQSMYGMKNPERFRLMVGPQSDLAARRARDLASIDEHDVHGRIRRRGSLLATYNANFGAISTVGSLDRGNAEGMLINQPPISLEERIRQLQQANARRLMKIYSQPGYNPFRFPLRRISLPGYNGSKSGDLGVGRETSSSYNRFQIRRDSLTHLSGTNGA